MTDKPIIFSAPMIRALLDGRKTQTRRMLPKAHPRCPHHNQIRMDVLVFDPQSPEVWYWDGVHDRVGASFKVPYAPGDRLWVREACATWTGESVDVVYRADETEDEWGNIRHDASLGLWKLRSPIHMPRWASRLTLTATDVRVQRLQDISEADAVAEGVQLSQQAKWGGLTHRFSFEALWNSIHGPNAWDANPWVCAITFDVTRGNIDAGAI